jgi:hypothetical protein
MRQVHRAGEKLFVDYSGQKPTIIDPTARPFHRTCFTEADGRRISGRLGRRDCRRRRIGSLGPRSQEIGCEEPRPGWYARPWP